RADWQLGESVGVAEVLISERIAWQVQRHYGRYGEIHAGESEGDVVFATDYSSPRTIVAWVLGLGANARLLGPEELTRELSQRMELLWERHSESFLDAVMGAAQAAKKGSAAAPRATEDRVVSERRPSRVRGGRRDATGEGEETSSSSSGGRASEAAIRPERFARLVTLASILIRAGRAGEQVSIADVCEKLQLSEDELHEDVNVLNVVNFGGGSYVLYAEIVEGEDGNVAIEVDPEPYSDNFDRPARLRPVEGKALVAAIDLIGEHIPEGSLSSAREKIVAALGEDPMEHGLQVAHAASDDADLARLVSTAIVEHRLIELEYYKENEDEISHRLV